MSNIAQTINVLQAMILTEGPQMLVTPTGYVYEMYAPHQGAKALRARIETPEISFKKTTILQSTWQSALQPGEKLEGRIPAVAGSASLKEDRLFLTLTNSSSNQASRVVVELLGGAEFGEAEGRVLSGEIHAHNTFADPTRVTPQAFALDCKRTALNLDLPPASVAAITVRLPGRNH